MILLAGSAAAQIGVPRAGAGASSSEGASGTVGSIRGRVVLPNGNPVSEAVKISLQVSRGTQTTAYTDQQGAFEFPNLAQGTYTLEIEGDRQRYEISTERVDVYRRMPTVVTIALKEKAAAGGAKPAERVVSLGEMEKVPAAARKEFDRAAKAAAEGKTEEAVGFLRKAVAIYPDYLAAHNDLGTHLLSLGRLDEAAEELQRAASLDPKAFNPQLNLGIVLYHQHKFADAAAALERALSLDGSSPAARLYAGLTFAEIGEVERAEKELTTAYQSGGAKYSLALFHLGQLYMKEGRRELALHSFEAYLREAPDAPDAAQARRYIGMLR